MSDSYKGFQDRIAFLRSLASDSLLLPERMELAAADRIEELEAEVKKLQGNLVIAQAYMSKAAVKRFRTQREKK